MHTPRSMTKLSQRMMMATGTTPWLINRSVRTRELILTASISGCVVSLEQLCV